MAAPAKPPDASAATPEDDLEVNRSLHEVMDLMAQETERLKVMLDYHRLVNARQDRIRHLIREIDLRQDRLEDLKQILLATRGEDEH